MSRVNFDFLTFDYPPPSVADASDLHRRLREQLEQADSVDACLALVGRWDTLRRQIDTWQALVHLRFNQDTTNPQFQRDRERSDRLSPKFIELDVRFKRCLLQSPHASGLRARLGRQALALWESDIATYDPAIEQEMVRQADGVAAYTELLARAELELDGSRYSLSEITRFLEFPDRDQRHRAAQTRWQWFATNHHTLDQLYGELVALRHTMATKLGFDNYLPLGYRLMSRTDYGPQEVEQFRAEVREHVVPLAQQLRQQQAQQLGLDSLQYWDEQVHELRGNPLPTGGHDWMLDRAREMFDALGPELSNFYRIMEQAHLLDLESRRGKAGGGFCTSFPTYGMPFIFANFNGTKGDVEVFTHEMGHAFQCYMSRDLPLADYLWPTMEACEIHSMGLEFLAWPQMDRFFGNGVPTGDGGQRFRRTHLAQAVLFLPYGVAVDHFQHLVYQTPSATAGERNQMWRQMEQTYLPWRDYGDLPHVDQGGMWQAQRHIYAAPFYYIDYALAQTCALQYWRWAGRDREAAMRSYIALCRRGGEASFTQLVEGAGLISPFEEGCLAEVVEDVRNELL